MAFLQRQTDRDRKQIPDCQELGLDYKQAWGNFLSGGTFLYLDGGSTGTISKTHKL